MGDKCPWCGAEAQAKYPRFVQFACGTCVSGVDHRRYESCYAHESEQLSARIKNLRSALSHIWDIYAAGTFAGDIAREALRADA